MVSKLRFRFRKPIKHTQPKRFHPGPVLTEERQATFQQSMQHPLSSHAHIPINDVEHSWESLRSALTTAGNSLLQQPRRPRKPWISQTTMQLADHKHQLWKAWQASDSPASKALYKSANRAARQSALADYQQHWSSELAQVQHSMRKGDIHSAYKCLNQLSKPKPRFATTLRQQGTGRLLQTAEERIAEWTSYCTDLLSAKPPISTATLALLPTPPPPPPPSAPPYPEPSLDEVVKAIRRL